MLAPVTDLARWKAAHSRPLVIDYCRWNEAIEATMRANVDLAISGTVRAASAGSATIAVERWYRGGSGPATVVVQRPADSAPGILYSPELAAGQRVLLVATDGALHLCDPSGPWSAEAEQLYVAAFGPGTPVS